MVKSDKEGKEMFEKAIEKIKDYQRIIIHRHRRPDGDALGAQIGLREIIRDNFPGKKAYAVGDETERLSFVGKTDKIPDSFYDGSLVFVLDTPERKLIGDERYAKGAEIVKIDHHILKEKFGNIEIVDEKCESCCGLITSMCMKHNLVVSKTAATALYTGIVTDSGRFRYDSVSPSTFMRAAWLLEKKADFVSVYDNLYADDLDAIKLRAKFIMKIKTTPNNVAYIKTTAEEIRELGTDFLTVSRGMVNTTAGIKGIDIRVNFTEDEEGGISAEIRSGKYNINPIAVKFGGGGHAKASGALLSSFAEADEMLACLDRLAGGKK